MMCLAEISALLHGWSLQRDLLIEYLHLIQDAYGCLSAAHIRALAEEMRLSQVEVYEVASFYDHFDVVSEGGRQPGAAHHPGLRWHIVHAGGCGGADCGPGSRGRPAAIRVVRAPCMGGCDVAPAARIGDREVGPRHRLGACSTLRLPERRVRRSRLRRPGRISREGRLCGVGYSAFRRAVVRHDHRHTVGRQSARARRRGLPDGQEMGLRARLRGTAPDDDQRRRGRAWHVQGQVLSGAQPARHV